MQVDKTCSMTGQQDTENTFFVYLNLYRVPYVYIQTQEADLIKLIAAQIYYTNCCKSFG